MAAQKNQSTPSVNGQAAADLLLRMGWNQDQIDKILAGPANTSILDIAGRKVTATAMPTSSATSVLAVAAEPVPAPQAIPPPPNIGQKQIADAVWASVNNGDPTPLAQIARVLKSLSPALQAYVLAACRDVKAYYVDNENFKKDFDAAQAGTNTQNAKDRKTGETVAGATTAAVTAVGVAALAANAVPIVGQVVSAILALGLAVAVSLTEAYALPVRKAEDQIHPGIEGIGVHYGFFPMPSDDPYEDVSRTLFQLIVQDPVAFSLPPVAHGTPFDFAPRLPSFQEAAHEMSLYPWDKKQ